MSTLSQPGKAQAVVNYNGFVPASTNLYPGDTITSFSAQFRLVMQPDGNLVLYSSGNQPLWTSGTFGAGYRAIAQPDGNFVVYNSSNVALWSSGSGGAGSKLVVQDDGNLVFQDSGGNAIWASSTYLTRLVPGETLLAGHFIQSAGGWRLLMQGDGNLVLYENGNARWWTNTHIYPNSRLVFQPDGNLVVYDANSVPRWNSGQHANANYVNIRSGALAMWRSDGSLAWSSAPIAGVGSAPTTASGVIGLARNYTGCTLSEIRAGTISPWTSYDWDWCAWFVSWCVRGLGYGIKTYANDFDFLPAVASPVPGDLAIWGSQHIGFVSNTSGGIQILDGNRVTTGNGYASTRVKEGGFWDAPVFRRPPYSS